MSSWGCVDYYSNVTYFMMIDDFSSIKTLFESCPDDSLTLIIDGLLTSFFKDNAVIETMDASLKLKGDKTDKPKIRKNRIKALEGIIAYAHILLEEVKKRKNLEFSSNISEGIKEANDILKGIGLNDAETP